MDGTPAVQRKELFVRFLSSVESELGVDVDVLRFFDVDASTQRFKVL